MTSRAAGPVASAVALALAAALAVNLSARHVERHAFEARVAQLGRDAERSQALWRAQLTACHAAGSQGQRLTQASYGAAAAGDARRLLQSPEGIDACARMESADQAVLSNLK